MDELGNILREAREAKGLTLSEVQDQTRINTKFLAAMENGQYNLLPTPVHVRGYLRNYARFLSLEPAPLLERYEVTKNSKSRRKAPPAPVNGDGPVGPAIPIRDDQPFFDPVNVGISDHKQSSPFPLQRLVLIIALLVALALIANRFIPLLTGKGDGSEAISNNITDTVNNIINNNAGPEFATATPDLSLIPGASDTITSTSRNIIDLPTATPTRPSLPATLDVIRLHLDITERTWMRVTVDDEVVFEGLARRGDDPYEWEAQQSVNLLTGNAIGIFVVINDIELGKLGGRGEVVDETWNTTGNQ
ncbi:MAG: RodZ domain-containing protein [Candidatus Promineifilaceae bacterium]